MDKIDNRSFQARIRRGWGQVFKLTWSYDFEGAFFLTDIKENPLISNFDITRDRGEGHMSILMNN